MGWSIGYDDRWKRDIGYGVPAICDHPDCKKRIDRGLSYVCGGDPYGGDRGCGLYFCSKHLFMSPRLPQLCDRCLKRRKPFAAKPDLPAWTHFKLNDESWADWRNERFIVMATQGGGGVAIAAFEELKPAVEYAEPLIGEMSVGIILPGGKWYDWDSHVWNFDE